MSGDDLGAVLSAATAYGDARAEAAREETAAVLAAARAAAEEAAQAIRVELAAARAELAAYKATHPDPAPIPATPTPTPQPAVAGPLLGMAAPADEWAARKREVEAGGGKLQARRIFLQGFDSSLLLVQAAHREGLVPIVSFKPGQWADVAAGKSDAPLRVLAGRLKALGKPVVMVVHHEPDEKSSPPDVGEAGTAAEFAAMQTHIIDVVKPVALNVQFAVIMNGWWWGAKGGLTDPQIEVWLPLFLRRRLDVIAADDYSPQGGEESVVKTKNRAAWARRVGGVSALGVGEFNGFKASDLANLVNFAKTEPLFRGGFLCVWNATGGTYLPLVETGLLDVFGALLKSWPQKAN